MRLKNGGWPFDQPINCSFTINEDSPQATGLVAWWPLGAGQYGMVRDVVGRFHMTAVNTPTLKTDGRFGLVTLFDDASSEYLSISRAVITTAPFTFMAWAQTDVPATDQTILCVGDVSVPGGWYRLFFSNSRLYWRAGSAGGVVWTGVNSIIADTWHHCCGVEAASDDRTVYLDGVQGTTSAVDSTVADLDTTRIARTATGSTNYLSGSARDLRIYNRALNDAEVAAIYRNPWELYRPLVPLWRGWAEAETFIVPVIMHHRQQQKVV